MKVKRIALIGVLCGLVFVLCAVQFWILYPINYKQEIINYSSKYNLDKSLVAALICVESRFKKDAVSHSGACGLMQIMPTTAVFISSQFDEEYNKDNLFISEINIKYGCFFLRYLFDKYADEIYVLACYNAGEGVVLSWAINGKLKIEDIKYQETKNYVKKILSLKKLYASRF